MSPGAVVLLVAGSYVVAYVAAWVIVALADRVGLVYRQARP